MSVNKRITVVTSVAILSFLTLGIFGYRNYVSPFFLRRDFERNSEFANFVFEKEQKLKESNDS